MITYIINKAKISQTIFTGLVALWGLSLCIIQTGCKKFVQVNPPVTAISSTTAYENDLSAAAAVTSIYIRMMTGALSQGNTSISMEGGLSADELKNYANSFAILSSCYANSLLSTNNYFWNELYQEIYVTNAVLEGLSKSDGVSPAEKNQLTGEAKFMRAFLHFYATNLYGDVPLVTTTDYRVNNVIHRSPQADVYRQIIADLKDAQQLLSTDFLSPTGGASTSERVRPNKGAATALLARAYLYNKAWDSAEAQATAVINNTALYALTSLDSVFLMNSSEAVWQMQPVVTGENTYEADYYILYSKPGSTSYPVALASSLLDSFEINDKRLVHWVGSFTSGGNTYYYPYKYKISSRKQKNPISEYLMMLRLGEQYLIRAEARAEKGNLSGAANDLNTIRVRAGLDSTTAATQTDLLAAIYHERQVELFSEWGHRWFDLKRTGNINPVMTVITPLKGGSTWNPNAALFPVPQTEITFNSNLTQNPGYHN